MNWTETESPTLQTARLILRPFSLADAKDVQRLAGHPLVAATTATIPHPYPDGAAEAWIAQHAVCYRERRAVQFAITVKTGELIGCIDLAVSEIHFRAEMGYWIGVEFWNQGFCTEAARAVVEYGFERMALNKITARHLEINPSSGKVMLKVGMEKEGHLRQEFFKNGKVHDMEVYGMLRTDFLTKKT